MWKGTEVLNLIFGILWQTRGTQMSVPFTDHELEKNGNSWRTAHLQPPSAYYNIAVCCHFFLPILLLLLTRCKKYI